MKRRWIILLPLLLVSHAALYFLAPHGAGPGGAVASAGSPASNAAITAPTKSHERIVDANAGSGGGASQLDKMLKTLLADPDLTDAEKKQAFSELMRDWIHRDLRSALELIYSPATRGRYGSLLPGFTHPELMREEMLRRPEEVWQWISSGGFGFARRDVTELWSKALLAAGRREPVMAAMAAASPIEQHDLFVALCRGAGAEDMQRLRAMLDGPLAGNGNLTSLRDYYAKQMAVLSDGDLKSLLAGEQNPEIRDFLSQQWVARDLVNLSPEQMAKRLAELPADLQRGAFRQLLEGAQIQELGDVAELINDTQLLPVWEMGDSSADMYRNQWINLLDRMWNSYRQPQEIIGELSAVKDMGQRTEVLMAAGTRWIQDRPAGFLEIAQGMEAGPERDAFLGGAAMSPSLEDDDFAALIGVLPEGAFRDKIVKEKMGSEAGPAKPGK